MLQHEEYDENGRVLQMSEDGFPRDTQPKEWVYITICIHVHPLLLSLLFRLKWNLESFTDDLSRSKDHLRRMVRTFFLYIPAVNYLSLLTLLN